MLTDCQDEAMKRAFCQVHLQDSLLNGKFIPANIFMYHLQLFSNSTILTCILSQSLSLCQALTMEEREDTVLKISQDEFGVQRDKWTYTHTHRTLEMLKFYIRRTNGECIITAPSRQQLLVLCFWWGMCNNFQLKV